MPDIKVLNMNGEEVGALALSEKVFGASVNEAVCQGCGCCTVACMSGAMDLKGFLNKQIMAEVDAICK